MSPRAAIYLLAVSLYASLCWAQVKPQPDTRSAEKQNPAISPAASPPTSEPERTAFDENIHDVYFDFDRYNLTAEDDAVLKKDADWLKQNPNVRFTIEGDADERGSIVYNVFLSDERAKVTRDTLVKLGVPDGQILFAVGWGKLYPICVQSDESCWKQNRRSHLAPWPPLDMGKRAANQLSSKTGASISGSAGR